MKTKYKLLVALILTMTISLDAFCCLGASQERILPIGTSEGCLVGIEILSNRYDNRESGPLAVWNIQFTLKGFNTDYSDFAIQHLEGVTGLANEDMEATLQNRIMQAIATCHDLTDFELFSPKAIRFCDFQKNCSSIALTEVNKQTGFRIKSQRKNYPIAFFDADYQGKIAHSYKSNAVFDTIIGSDLKISSIRNYENSHYQLVAFHLGLGQEFINPETDKHYEKNEYAYDKPLTTIQDATFIEPILHHGTGFDYFVMNEK